MIDGIPIGMGYFAVAFSLGIVARTAGLTPAGGFFSSLFTRASAGEYGCYSLIAAGAAIIEVIAVCFIANLRYLLMGAALSQKFADSMPLWKRIVCACCITDEIFGISIAYPGKLPVSYPLGATAVAGIMWAAGTASGITVGNILPEYIVNALGVALYGMFIAIIIPPCRKNRFLLAIVAASFIISTICAKLPPFSTMSAGIRIVVLTIVISALAAVLKPVEDEE
ncbi:MAG: AzlC family ABC transporter permease [Bacteroidia bacterium]|nr:AzlC family ABC transporter permease [Bacteroidia bacterium]